jgi:hypothetical protein
MSTEDTRKMNRHVRREALEWAKRWELALAVIEAAADGVQESLEHPGSRHLDCGATPCELCQAITAWEA